ncbi:hypothetical protein [Neorhodopirellula pilleata]|uniref:SWIM-type domain-containing protein n=1 Tax=Neorhodopirellula pilleata TaxID=2714738 RepID=A0A5C6AQ74_9BACT|nr:hypothetical protein [Neorhodopirellula pilleata]TWU01627.1 hypothetical protein Pla100_13620 [Neorhodopirellula pilleata]
MNKRPTMDAGLLATMIDAAPGRVRKRLDREATAAEAWAWTEQANVWSIEAGEETVRLEPGEDGCLVRGESMSCSCLLSPKCFHLLACVTTLTIHVTEASSTEPDGESPPDSQSGTPIELHKSEEPSAAPVKISADMRSTAEQCLQALEGLLISGARAGGLIIQSSLLRAAHQARSQSMLNLSSALIRVTEGVQRIRAGDDHADSDGLRSDVVTAIETAFELTRSESLHPAKLGYTRRPFSPVSLKRLRGVVAEPILTLSGYAGVVVHFIGDDGRLYQVVETRPGEAALVSQAYRGGIDLGGTTASAQVISRASIDVQNLTASYDGRLGKGSKTRWAIMPSDDEQQDANQEAVGRWGRAAADQIRDVFESADAADAMPRGGWDLVFFKGTILGADGRSVVLQLDDGVRVNLGIAIDHASLRFRENMELLARCVGLEIEVFGRVRLDRAGWIDALSFRAGSDNVSLPEAWGGRCHLGLDELKRHYFRNTERFAMEVDDRPRFDEDSIASDGGDLFPGLTRRLTTLVLGGRGAVGSIGSATHRRDRARLRSRGQVTAAAMLDALAVVTSDVRNNSARLTSVQNARPPRPIQKLAQGLAMANAYCEASRRQYQRTKWLHLWDSEIAPAAR